jgi:hypothetical protein
MKDTFILNLIHRPELAPEYAEKLGGQGKKENIGDKGLLSESFDIFKFQQDTAHKNGLKTTIQMTYASLFNDEAVEIAKHDHEVYGDEIALSLLGLPCEEFRKKYNTKDFCIWMFSKEDKMKIVDDVFALFYKKFGFYPKSTASYYIDAFTLRYIKEKYPSVICAVATCWEEGPKAYHTCNNSWYTFLDGGPWAPWYASKENTHCPASDAKDDVGIVCIPHLSRDLIACFDGNGSNFGTHPQNILRGMIYEDNEIPYFYNLVDQYRHLAKYNDGFAYNMVFVGPGWLNKLGRWEAPYSLLKKSYEDGLAYYGKLKKEGKLVDMTMEEFGEFYKENKGYDDPQCALWKDILYGSKKEYFWYADPYFRTCLDFNQGGAMIDFRPYVAKLPWEVGIGTKHIYDASYPYLIQANYRAGYFTHYAGAGTIKSAKIIYEKEEVDLCLERTLAKYEKVGEDTKVIVDPVTVKFNDFEVVIESSFLFKKGTGVIEITRKILNDIGDRKITIEEYFTGAFGTNEYQEDMSKITLGFTKNNGDSHMNFEYKCRDLIEKNVDSIYANIPDVETLLSMGGDNDSCLITEGHAFSPVYRLALKKTLSKGEMKTWLKVKKAN